MIRSFMAIAMVGLFWVTPLAAADIAAGLSEALAVGTSRVVDRLGRPGGFLNDPKVRIPLPEPLAQARGGLAALGLSGAVDELDVRMNRAAEQATPVAEELIIAAIRGMTFDDAAGILRGPRNSATRYLERTTGPALAARMRPVVETALADVGAVQQFATVASAFKSVPFAGALDLDLAGYVVEQAQRAIFTYLGEEEAAIRSNPAARTTSILKSVFGG